MSTNTTDKSEVEVATLPQPRACTVCYQCCLYNKGLRIFYLFLLVAVLYVGCSLAIAYGAHISVGAGFAWPLFGVSAISSLIASLWSCIAWCNLSDEQKKRWYRHLSCQYNDDHRSSAAFFAAFIGCIPFTITFLTTLTFLRLRGEENDPTKGHIGESIETAPGILIFLGLVMGLVAYMVGSIILYCVLRIGVSFIFCCVDAYHEEHQRIVAEMAPALSAPESVAVDLAAPDAPALPMESIAVVPIEAA